MLAAQARPEGMVGPRAMSQCTTRMVALQRAVPRVVRLVRVDPGPHRGIPREATRPRSTTNTTLFTMTAASEAGEDLGIME